MKKILLAITVFFLAIGAKAQILTPVKWAYAAKRTGTAGAVVLLKATIDPGWHIYSQHVKNSGLKTTFTFSPSKNYKLVSATSEPKPILKYEKALGITVSYFENTVVFQQKIKLLSANAATVTGKLVYMACNKSCLPPDEVAFSIPIGK